MQNYHQRQLNNNQNNNYHNYHQQQQQQQQPQIPSNPVYEQPLSDEEFLLRYKQKYPEEYEKLMKEAYLAEMNKKNMENNNLNNINSIHESPYENNEGIEGNSINMNNNEDLDEKGADIERILNNPNITNISPLELFLCNTKLYNDFFPFFKRQNVLSLEEAILFRNYQIKNRELSSKVSLKNFNKEV